MVFWIRNIDDANPLVLWLPPALCDPLGRQVAFDTENHFARELFGHRFEEGFLMWAGEGLPEDDAINFQGRSPGG